MTRGLSGVYRQLSGTGIYESELSYLWVLAGFVIALPGFLGVVFHLYSITRAMSLVEQCLDDVENVPLTPVAERPEHADVAIRATQ